VITPATVILIHGLMGNTVNMKRIEWDLRRQGYHTINLAYPSRRASIAELSERYLAPAIERVPPGETVHFVAHSMGAILVRQYLCAHSITNLGRVVMIAPPNHGSEIVDWCRRSSMVRRFLGPAGCSLGTSIRDLPQCLCVREMDVGVIAGDRTLNPCGWFLFSGPCDGTVSVESARLQGMRDFLVVHGSHTLMLWKPSVVREVRSYLETGRFARGLALTRVSILQTQDAQR